MDMVKFIGFDVDKNIELISEKDTIWASSKNIQEIFKTSQQNADKHIHEALENDIGEMQTFPILSTNNKVYQTNCYNLDIVMYIGFKVHTKKALIFQKWAINILRQPALDKVLEMTSKMDNLRIDYDGRIMQINTNHLNQVEIINDQHNARINLLNNAIRQERETMADDPELRVKIHWIIFICRVIDEENEDIDDEEPNTDDYYDLIYVKIFCSNESNLGDMIQAFTDKIQSNVSTGRIRALHEDSIYTTNGITFNHKITQVINKNPRRIDNRMLPVKLYRTYSIRSFLDYNHADDDETASINFINDLIIEISRANSEIRIP